MAKILIPLNLLWFCSLRTIFFELSRICHCSVIKVLCFSLPISNFYIISCSFLFVKNFFQLFLKSFCSLELLSSISAAAPCDVDYHITPSAECQHLFLKFFIFFKLLIQLYYCIYNLLKINFLSIQPFFLLLMALCQEFKDLCSFLSALPGASLSPRQRPLSASGGNGLQG